MKGEGQTSPPWDGQVTAVGQSKRPLWCGCDGCGVLPGRRRRHAASAPASQPRPLCPQAAFGCLLLLLGPCLLARLLMGSVRNVSLQHGTEQKGQTHAACKAAHHTWVSAFVAIRTALCRCVYEVNALQALGTAQSHPPACTDSATATPHPPKPYTHNQIHTQRRAY